MALIALILTYFTARLCLYSVGGVTFIKVIVITCFFPQYFGNAWSFLHMLYYPFVKLKPFKEVFLQEMPATAIVYFIRKESAGLYERMEYSFANNFLPNVDLWIASGQAAQEYIDYEMSVIARLKEQFGDNRVFRLHSENPNDKKREMMDLWLEKYTGRYKYYIPCDGDSILEKNSVLRMARKAEHPENRHIGCFQANILISSAYTYFSDNNRRAVGILMELYLKIKQAVFKSTLCFGHNCLIKCEAMRGLNIPAGVMSHDIFDTAYMEKRGYKTVFCADVITYEESPANYVEERKRNIRWMKGDFESMPLIFDRDIPFATRFMTYFNLHNYLTSVCFFVSMTLGLFANWGLYSWWGMLIILQYMLTFGILAITIFHHFILARNFGDIKEIIREIVFTTLVASNSTMYNVIDLILVFLNKQQWSLWDPMAKDPREGLSWYRAVRSLWPSTVVGIFWASYLIHRRWTATLILSAPILISFIFSIPLTYYSAKEMPERKVGSTLFMHRRHRQ
ncbi:MAG: hypothetical protein JXB40_02440 [Candidatus Omnitrophica bacterium]|nr:hypothetical protein [Candidatus Omnitrophota bacterium]